MIIELVGLPGAGKTTLSKALVEKGISKPFTVSNKATLILLALLGMVLHPIAAAAVTSRVLAHSRGMRLYGIVNAVLYPFAAYATGTFSPVHIEHGFFQGLLGFPAKNISLAVSLLPRPAYIMLLEAPREVRESRLASRGWRPRAEFGKEAEQAFATTTEAAYPAFFHTLKHQLPKKLIVCTEDATIEKQVLQVVCALKARTSRSHLFVKRGSYLLAYLLSLPAHFLRKESPVVVLMYHAVDHSGYVLSVPPAVFEKQMAYIARHMRPVHLADAVSLHKKQWPRGAVAVTFDDGYADLQTAALPVLRKYRIPATIFVPTDTTVYTDPLNTPRLSWNDLRVLAAYSLISIESHSKTHRRMGALSKEDALEEATGSAEAIEKELGTRPRFFAYPLGDKNSQAEEAVRRAGYQGAFGITQGTLASSKGNFSLNRVQVDSTMSPWLFRIRLTGAVDMQQKLTTWWRGV